MNSFVSMRDPRAFSVRFPEAGTAPHSFFPANSDWAFSRLASLLYTHDGSCAGKGPAFSCSSLHFFQNASRAGSHQQLRIKLSVQCPTADSSHSVQTAVQRLQLFPVHIRCDIIHSDTIFMLFLFAAAGFIPGSFPSSSFPTHSLRLRGVSVRTISFLSKMSVISPGAYIEKSTSHQGMCAPYRDLSPLQKQNAPRNGFVTPGSGIQIPVRSNPAFRRRRPLIVPSCQKSGLPVYADGST